MFVCSLVLDAQRFEQELQIAFFFKHTVSFYLRLEDFQLHACTAVQFALTVCRFPLDRNNVTASTEISTLIVSALYEYRVNIAWK